MDAPGAKTQLEAVLVWGCVCVTFQTDFLSLDSVFSVNTFISITLFSVTMSHSEPGQQPADTRSVPMARNHPKIKVPRVAESTSP